jgi:hypothetical protein
MKKDKKNKWQSKREHAASKNSQFDPRIHDLGRQGYGFQMKRGYKATEDELSGKNLPFKSERENDN